LKDISRGARGRRLVQERGGIMKKRKDISERMTEFVDEEREWLSLTPAQRISETTKLWKLYIALGGKLDPEPDPQSPFNFEETSR